LRQPLQSSSTPGCDMQKVHTCQCSCCFWFRILPRNGMVRQSRTLSRMFRQRLCTAALGNGVTHCRSFAHDVQNLDVPCKDGRGTCLRQFTPSALSAAPHAVRGSLELWGANGMCERRVRRRLPVPSLAVEGQHAPGTRNCCSRLPPVGQDSTTLVGLDSEPIYERGKHSEGCGCWAVSSGRRGHSPA
jgi:hypothetical protein